MGRRKLVRYYGRDASQMQKAYKRMVCLFVRALPDLADKLFHFNITFWWKKPLTLEVFL